MQEDSVKANQRRMDLLDLLGRIQYEIQAVKETALFVFGGVQSGKTTICDAILGERLSGLEDQYNPDQIVYKHKVSDSEHKVQSEQEQSIRSMIPKIRTIRNQISVVEIPGLVLENILFECDWKKKVALGFLIEKIFQKVKRAKFILVIEESMLYLGNIHYIFKLFDNFVNIFKLKQAEQHGLRQKLLNSMEILINKCRYSKQQNINSLQGLSKRIMNAKNFSRQNVQYICEWISQICSNNRMQRIRVAKVGQQLQKLDQDKFLRFNQNYLNLNNSQLIKSLKQSIFFESEDNIQQLRKYYNMNRQQEFQFLRDLNFSMFQSIDDKKLQRYVSLQKCKLGSIYSYFKHYLSDNYMKLFKSNKQKSAKKIKYDLGQAILKNCELYFQFQKLFKYCQQEYRSQDQQQQIKRMIKEIIQSLIQIHKLLCQRWTDVAKFQLVETYLKRNFQLLYFLNNTQKERGRDFLGQYKFLDIYRIFLIKKISDTQSQEAIKLLFPRRQDNIKLYQFSQQEIFEYQLNQDKIEKLKRYTLSLIIDSFDEEKQCQQLVKWILKAIYYLNAHLIKQCQRIQDNEQILSSQKHQLSFAQSLHLHFYANKLAQITLKKAYNEKFIEPIQPYHPQTRQFGISNLQYAMDILLCTKNVKMIDDYFWQVMEILEDDFNLKLIICNDYICLNQYLRRFDKNKEILLYILHLQMQAKNDQGLQETIKKLQDLEELKEESKNEWRQKIIIAGVNENLMFKIQCFKEGLEWVLNE